MEANKQLPIQKVNEGYNICRTIFSIEQFNTFKITIAIVFQTFSNTFAIFREILRYKLNL
jgi:hypothetical protein